MSLIELLLCQTDLVIRYLLDVDVQSWVLGITVLLEDDAEVVAVIQTQSIRHSVFDQLQSIADVDPLELGLCLIWVSLVLHGLEEDTEPHLVGYALLQVQEGNPAFFLNRLHRTNFEGSCLLGEHPATARTLDVDVVRGWWQEWYPDVDHHPLRCPARKEARTSLCLT